MQLQEHLEIFSPFGARYGETPFLAGKAVAVVDSSLDVRCVDLCHITPLGEDGKGKMLSVSEGREVELLQVPASDFFAYLLARVGSSACLDQLIEDNTRAN